MSAAPAPAGRRGARRALWAALMLASAALLGEWGLRTLGFWHAPGVLFEPWRELELDASMARGADLCRFDRELLWAPRPGAPLGSGEESLNALGGRGALPPLEKQAGVLRIAVLGDEVALAQGLPFEQGYAAQLQQGLAAAGQPCELVLLGLPDGALAQQRRWYARELARWAPDLLVLDACGRHEHQPAHGAGDLEKLAALDAWPRACFGSRLAQFGGFALALARGEHWGARQRVLLRAQAERAQLAPAGQFAFKGVRRLAPAEYQQELAGFARELRAAGVRLLVLGLPGAPGAEPKAPVLEGYARAAREVCAAEGASLLDAQAIWGAAPDARDFAERFALSPAGHARVGAALAQRVLQELAR